MIPSGSGISAGEGIHYPLQYFWASLVAQLVKNLPAMWETWVRSLSREDPLEKGMAGNPFQYSCLENPVARGAWWATVHGVTKSRTRLSDQQPRITKACSRYWAFVRCVGFLW